MTTLECSASDNQYNRAARKMLFDMMGFSYLKETPVNMATLTVSLAYLLHMVDSCACELVAERVGLLTVGFSGDKPGLVTEQPPISGDFLKLHIKQDVIYRASDCLEALISVICKQFGNAAKPLPHRLEVRSQPNPNQPGYQSFDITLVLMAAEAT